MFYVIQTIGGREHKALRQIRKLVDPTLFKSVFVPEYELKKSFGGTWRVCREVLFPGYVFVDTKTPESFSAALGAVPELTRVLAGGTADGDVRRFIPLTEQEQTLICAFTDDEERVMHMSEGIVEGDDVVVRSGPLMNFSALVRKVDRHKRLAYLEVPMCGRLLTIKAGLEIVRKTKQRDDNA